MANVQISPTPHSELISNQAAVLKNPNDSRRSFDKLQCGIRNTEQDTIVMLLNLLLLLIMIISGPVVTQKPVRKTWMKVNNKSVESLKLMDIASVSESVDDLNNEELKQPLLNTAPLTLHSEETQMITEG